MREKSLVFEPLLELDLRETDDSRERVKAICLPLFLSLSYTGSGVIFFIHPVKYIQTVLCLYIFTRFYFFIFYFVSYSNEVMRPIFKMVAYIFDTDC